MCGSRAGLVWRPAGTRAVFAGRNIRAQGAEGMHGAQDQACWEATDDKNKQQPKNTTCDCDVFNLFNQYIYDMLTFARVGNS